MKKLFFALCILTTSSVSAQTIITQAIITTKTSMVVPDDVDVPAPPPPTMSGEGGQQRVMMFNNMGGEDTKATMWYKNDKVKVLSETSMGRNTIIYDKGSKRTTTLIEAMGMKRGFYSTEEDEIERRRKMDSLMGTTNQRNEVTGVDVEYVDSSRKIAGYSAKKALIKSTRANGKVDTLSVWYTPELKMGEGFTFSTGSMFGGGVNTSGFNKLTGFPLEYTIKMRRGMLQTTTVTKIDLKKEVDDKEFNVPKDFELKPMKDMINGNGGGNFQMRIER